MRVVILHDQISPDARKDIADAQDQARAISDALRELGHVPVVMEASLNLLALKRQLAAARPDVVFNIVESLNGHAQLIAAVCGLLDAMRIPYTGASHEGQFVTSDKTLAKRIMRAAAVPTPVWFSFDEIKNPDDLAFTDRPFVPGRYIIKSLWEHASVGLDEDSVVFAESVDTLRDEIERRLEQLGGQGFAEAYIDGREFNIALLAGDNGPEPLVPAEIVFEGYRAGKPRVVGYRAKWDEQSFEYNHTLRRYDFPDADQPLLERLAAIAIECWQLFDLRGYARVDFRVDQAIDAAPSRIGTRSRTIACASQNASQPWVLEINTNPCLSPDAGFAAALEQSGISYAQAIDRILAEALRRGALKSPASISAHG